MTKELRNFNQDRWKLLRAIMVDAALKDGAKNVAVVLLTQFAGRDSGRARASHNEIAEAVAMKPDTVYRHLKSLANRGYIAVLETFRGGAVYVFLAGNVTHSNVVQMAAELGHTSEISERNSDAHPTNPDAHPTSPAPPYKEHQNLSKNARPRPAAHRLARVEPKSDAAAAWDEWNARKGLPPLEDLPALRRDGAFWPTTHTPPNDPAQFDWIAAEQVMRWAVEMNDAKRGQNDERAA